MSHPSFLRNPSSIEAVQELEGFPDWEGEQSQGWGDGHPTGDSTPSGAGKAGQELLATACRFDGISNARALERDQYDPLLRGTIKRHRPAAQSPAVSGDFPSTTGADSPWPVRIYHSENSFRSAIAV